ncbi:MAG: sensor histidine kinase [Cytophaga sp.]|uniref:sensor histidine kinase n=1 Tax=Cytophaga sp. TaxID=29535 RepID=UPI003F7FFA5A
MEIAAIPANEAERLQALREYSILDSLPEKDFEDITRIASEICQTPISLITLIDADRQWFKSKVGIDHTGSSRDQAFCAHAINAPDEILNIKDSRLDQRFFDNPFVTGDPNAVFYAGVPLVNADGFALGTLCVIDQVPRELDTSQLNLLRALSNQVVKLFELRKVNQRLAAHEQEMQERNKDLEQFGYMISHDIKSPLRNIISLTTILQKSLAGKADAYETEVIDHLVNTSLRLKSLIDGIIAYYLDVNIDVQNKQHIQLDALFTELITLLDPRQECVITHHAEINTVVANEVALKQILINLITNGIKYNDKEVVKIDIHIIDKPDQYEWIVRDNGSGIEKEHFNEIFKSFKTLGRKDRFNNSGTGIGLSTVKKLVEKTGGTIRVESDPGIGCTFTFTIKK